MADPIVGSLNGDLVAYIEDASPILLDAGGDAIITDADSPDFDTGIVTVAIVANHVAGEDVLGVRNQGTGVGEIGVSGSNITYQGLLIGGYSGGSGGIDLSIVLNANATPTAVQALLQNLTYVNANTGDPSAATRIARIIVTDGDGGTSNFSNVAISVTPVKDAPTAVVLTHLHGPISENVPTVLPIKIADIAITDVDGGANLLSLAGADAGLFKIVGKQLWLKAGAHLDFETNPVLNLTVRVDGVGVGVAVDAFQSLAINIIHALVIKGTSGPDTLVGTNHDEIIFGLPGNDRIVGSGGNDRLVGGLGRDVLTGGHDSDVFVFRSIADSAPRQSGLVNALFLGAAAGQGLRDIITDFTHGQDRIDLSAIDANTRVKGDQHFVWRGIGDFTGTAGQLIEKIYNPAGSAADKTVIYGDINGDARADFQIELTGLKALAASDFVL